METGEEGNQSASYPSLRNRVVVITGGATGIGEALVRAFCGQGSQVVFFDVQDEAGNALVEQLASSSAHRPAYVRCDLTDIGALQAAIQSVIERFGWVDVLVNNAGNDTRHSVEEVTSASWDGTMAVNLKQQFFMAQSVIPSMRARGGGSIVNMGSISWVIPSTNLPVYVTAKAAIVGMTRALAHEVGVDNIRVNCVMPGAIMTDRQRRLWLTKEYETEIYKRQALKRMLEPVEVARLVLFLAASDSSAITNQSYVIDGGWV